MSRFALGTILLTVDAAVPRVLPLVLKWPPPTPTEVYDVIVALNPIVTQVLTTFFAVWLQWILTFLTMSYAWNDRVWSVLPPLWAVLYAVHPVISQDNKTSGQWDVRMSVMAALVVAWGLRLTFNGARRNVFSWGHEDYRMIYMRETYLSNRFLWFCLYMSFVVGHCTGMLSLICTPFYFAWIRRGDSPAFTVLDGLAAGGMLFGIILEAVADEQQWRFHQRKHSLQKEEESKALAKASADATASAGNDEATETETSAPKAEVGDAASGIDGFCQSGLFAWCRHPSYFAEMLIWSFFYLFSVSCSGIWVNWTIAGPLLYIALFQMTTPLAEAISLSKYPAYAEYQRRVSRLIPLPPSVPPSSHVKQE